jgi:hypothetical protein
VDVLISSIVLIAICIIAMTVMFNNKKFYIMEHTAFIAYSLIYITFFLVHTPEQWDRDVDIGECSLEENTYATYPAHIGPFTHP